jgi:signal transduction histidine kinase
MVVNDEHGNGRAARRAARQSARLEQLITQLLLLARSDTGQLATRRQPVDLAVLLTDIRAAAPARDLSIDIDVPPGTVIIGNPEELSRMFRNLFDNAVRYATRHLLIAAVPAADRVVVEVCDDGPGIPPDERERAFGRFVRLDPSRGHASGSSGLGLAIARDIATAHGASIVLTEAAGGGTRAVVTLPRLIEGSGGAAIRPE